MQMQMRMHAGAEIAEIAPAPGFWKPLTTLAQAWRTLTAVRAASYRPEKHYMRWPGPKWHAKHAQAHDVAAR